MTYIKRYFVPVALLLVVLLILTATLGIVVFKRNQYFSAFDISSIEPLSYELYFASLPEKTSSVYMDSSEAFLILGYLLYISQIYYFIYLRCQTKKYIINTEPKNKMVVLLQ